MRILENLCLSMYGTVKFMKSFATWQHRCDVNSNFLSYNPAPLSLVQFQPKYNQFI